MDTRPRVEATAAPTPSRELGRVLFWPLVAWTVAAILIGLCYRQSAATRRLSQRADELSAATARLQLLDADALPPTQEEAEEALHVEPYIAAVHDRLQAATHSGMSPQDSLELSTAAAGVDRAILKDFAMIKQNRMPEAMRLDAEEVDPAFDRFQKAIGKAQAHADTADALGDAVSMFVTFASIAICIAILAVTTARYQRRSHIEAQNRIRALEEAERANRAKSEFL